MDRAENARRDDPAQEENKLLNQFADAVGVSYKFPSFIREEIAASVMRVRDAEMECLRAELAVYRSMGLGDVDGRISATCKNPDHPTWLRAPDDNRGCPWCFLRVAEERLERLGG